MTNDRDYNSGAVFTIIKKLCAYIQEILPHVKTVHYFTDGPVTQYRNSAVMSIVTRHYELFGLQCSWLYFEAHHGKGPCDGVGAASKRGANLQVLRGREIRSAEQYVAAANESSTSTMTHILITEAEFKV